MTAAIAPAQVADGQEPNRGAALDLASQDPKVALSRIKMADGYEVSLFASEVEFPDLAKPLAMTFDTRGRLWVLTSPTYPHVLPDEKPNDKLIVLEDTNHDGKADKSTVFADNLYIPTGFALGDGGVYIAQQPTLMFMKDTNGDGKADERRILLHGFGTEDSHHSIHAWQWGPDGALYFQEGTFLHSQVETPYGPRRLAYAGVWRYEPRTEKLDVFVSYPFANPWGHVIDAWGQNFVSDASNGYNYWGTAFSGHVDYPNKQKSMQEWTLTRVRPTSGSEFVKSRHFPESAQGNFLYNNVIGFLGIKQYKTVEEGSGFVGVEVEPLLQSTDPNFRPVGMQFGPDGALYVIDWFNPLIGHMQYSIRDPRRDKSRGRVWRITAKGRPLLTPPKIDGATIAEQLDLLKAYEDRTRYQARLALREWPTAQVIPAVERVDCRARQGRPGLRAPPARGALGARAQRPREPAAAGAVARSPGVPRPRGGRARPAALVRSRRRWDGAAGAGRQGSGAAGAARGRARPQLRADRRSGQHGAAGARAADGLLPALCARFDDEHARAGVEAVAHDWRHVRDRQPGRTHVRARSPLASRPRARQAQHARLRRAVVATGRRPGCASRGTRRARDAERHDVAARDHRGREPHGRHARQRRGIGRSHAGAGDAVAGATRARARRRRAPRARGTQRQHPRRRVPGADAGGRQCHRGVAARVGESPPAHRPVARRGEARAGSGPRQPPGAAGAGTAQRVRGRCAPGRWRRRSPVATCGWCGRAAPRS